MTELKTSISEAKKDEWGAIQIWFGLKFEPPYPREGEGFPDTMLTPDPKPQDDPGEGDHERREPGEHEDDGKDEHKEEA